MKRFSVCTFVITVVLASLLLVPTQAFAKDLSMDPVSIQAHVDTAGVLHVTERRTFNFDGSYNGVFWLLPRGNSEDNVRVEEAGIVSDGSFVPYIQTNAASKGDDGYFTQSPDGNNIEVKIYHPVRNESAVYQIKYTIKGAVTAHKDVAELYWKYVSDGWDEPSENVSCQIDLPVPQDAKVEQGTIRAWGHGPLDGTVKVTSDGADFVTPYVGTAEFAEARITFPVSWISDMTPGASDALDTILGEEQKWADTANAQRETRITMMYVLAALSVVALILGFLLYRFAKTDYENKHKTIFNSEYFRDVPENLHPALMSVLLERTEPDSRALSASVLRLVDTSTLELVKSSAKRSILGGTKEVWQLQGLTSFESHEEDSSNLSLDQKTLESLLALSRQQDTLTFNDIKNDAQSLRYKNAVDDLVSEAYAQATERGYLGDPEPLRMGTTIFALVLGGASFVSALALVPMDVFKLFGNPFIVLFVALCAGSLFTVIMSGVLLASNSTLSVEGREIKAQLKALKRWLQDFTKLDEAVPTDVVLWNRLLVAAVVFGISEQVVRDLKMVAPEILESPDLFYGYMWCSMYYGGATPADAFDTASSNGLGTTMSSGSGFGGGFSSGGGGGFGGGGGGGGF